ncbi:glycosyltransferase family protein [Phaeodactylibacter luteus]|uniref:YfhO family protein n=1 Tax=Phaeodactylibacter luteus TaxID=1564516 RepID=A0A5C6S556_9BACT|nr:YfhO family protein [Phaeodactylibacter luteus]TXB69553.1 YfhO family protein [Phaeodactylibacter luteus]
MMKQVIPHLAAIGIFLAASAAFFYPQLEGKVVPQGDIIQYRGMSQEIREYKAATGETALWTNAMFGGMPTYQINTVSEGNSLKILGKAGRLGISGPIGQFFTAMLGFYILMAVLGANPWLGVIGGLAFGLTTNNLILFEAGHMTKLKAISYLPLVAAGMLLAFRKRYLAGGLLFAAGLGLNIMANHVQMTYYFALTVLVFGIAELAHSIRKNRLPHFAKAAGALIVGALLALGSSSSNLWVTYEYSKDTMRGEPILQPDGEPQSSSETEGLDWEYAMQWSNGTIDLFASYIPGVAGGGSQELVGDDAAIVKDLERKGARLPSDFRAPLYWGSLPFTSGPIYFGAIAFFLFLVGLVLVKGPVKWWIGIGTLLTLLLSMGSNLEGFNRLFFDYMPLYNKFRTPNSILSVTAFLVPVLGFLTVHKIINEKVTREEAMHALKVGGGIALAIPLFFALIGPSMFDFSSPGDARYEQAGYSLSAIVQDRQALMRSDAFRTLILAAIATGLLWGYLQGKLKLPVFLLALGLITVFDYWTVGRRYLNEGSFASERQSEAQLQPRPVDEQILQDPDPHYRVYDVSINTFNSSQASFHHKTIGGYHAAKLQRMQDIIDRHIAKGNQKVLDMLNAKYFIFGQPGQEQAQLNPNALGNAWLAKDIKQVATPNEEIDALTDFQPDSTAIVHEEFADYLSGLAPTGNGSISLSSYAPNRLAYEADVDGEQLAVFSEVWYGPDKGWQAYIDGQPVEHIRADYILRALRIPDGKHEIVFEFAPKSYEQGVLASRIFSTLILLGLLGFIGYNGYQQRKAEA